MTYHHKKDRCMKETKEIIENIIRMKASDYDLSEPSDIVTSGKTIQVISRGEPDPNILPNDTEREVEGCSEEEMMEDSECISLDDMENYEPVQEIDFEVSEVKDDFEKKKKQRNYIEFKKDYEEM